MAAPTNAAHVKKVLANPEPSRGRAVLGADEAAADRWRAQRNQAAE